MQSELQHLNLSQEYFETPEISRPAENLPIRRDMISLLIYVRDNKVIGAQSTGNMPLKAGLQPNSKNVK